MINKILKNVRDIWDTLETGCPEPKHMSYVLQSRRRVIFFLFDAENPSHPLVVVKMSRAPSDNLILEQSVERTQQVRILLAPDIKNTVPAMKLLEPVNGLSGAAEKALPGRPLEVSSLNNNYDTVLMNNCGAFAEWLIRFQTCTKNSSLEITGEVIESFLSRPPEKLSSISGVHRSAVKNVITKELLGLRIPLVWVYGDAHPSNILTKNGAVSGIVDWEGTAPGQWPVFDWFQFILSMSGELIKAQYPAMSKLERTTTACKFLIEDPASGLAKIMQQQTRQFFSAISLAPESILPMFLVFLIDYYWYDDKETLLQQILPGLAS